MFGIKAVVHEMRADVGLAVDDGVTGRVARAVDNHGRVATLALALVFSLAGCVTVSTQPRLTQAEAMRCMAADTLSFLHSIGPNGDQPPASPLPGSDRVQERVNQVAADLGIDLGSSMTPDAEEDAKIRMTERFGSDPEMVGLCRTLVLPEIEGLSEP